MLNNPVAWTIFTIIAASASAWGGAKYALTSHETRLKEHDLLFRRFDEQLQLKVSVTDCRVDRVDCLGNRNSADCVLNGKLDRIFAAIAEQERKREEGKDQYNTLFRNLSVDIAALKTILDERKDADDRRSFVHRQSKEDI